jgi:hypothetical protein
MNFPRRSVKDHRLRRQRAYSSGTGAGGDQIRSFRNSETVPQIHPKFSLAEYGLGRDRVPEVDLLVALHHVFGRGVVVLADVFEEFRVSAPSSGDSLRSRTSNGDLVLCPEQGFRL